MPDATERNALYVGIIGLMVGSLLSGIALVQTYQVALLNASLAEKQTTLTEQANNLTQLSLMLQNIISNFQPKIIPYYSVATLDDVNLRSTLDCFGQIDDYGSLNISLVVVTPHASILNFTETGFSITVRNLTSGTDWLDSSNSFGSHVTLMPNLPYGSVSSSKPYDFLRTQFFDYWPEAFVQPGVTQVNFTIPMNAKLALNSNFNIISEDYRDNLGTVNANVTLFDLQTENYVATYYCSAQLLVDVNSTYG